MPAVMHQVLISKHAQMGAAVTQVVVMLRGAVQRLVTGMVAWVVSLAATIATAAAAAAVTG
jgi:hypothetical protein